MNKNTLDKELYRALANRATECSPTEFQSLLKKFGHDDEAIESMQKAVRDRLRYEDSGSYCESASSGYAPLMRKQGMLDDFYINRPIENNLDLSRKFSNGAADNRALLQAIQRLESRLDRLESSQTSKTDNRFRKR